MGKGSQGQSKKRKTRLKGTATHRPCVDCGKMKNRLTEFKPRWAGCASHVTGRGRRYFEPGCEECEKLVNGNIRQPRCIECDKARPKKRREVAPEPAAVEQEPIVVEPAAVEQEPEPAPEQAEEAPEPEPKVTAHEEPSPESVKVPEPAPEPATAKPKRPKIATMADLSALFGSEESDPGEQ